MNKAQELVQEIHDAFDNAQDVLLEEAREIISKNKVRDTDHVKRMAELGFVNSKVVQEASKKLKKAVETAEQAEVVLHYRETYPFLKFLTEEKLDEICEKYKLIHAPVGNYVEDVPEKNLKEIAEAQPLKPGDEPVIVHVARFKGKHGSKSEREAIKQFRAEVGSYLSNAEAREELRRIGLEAHTNWLERFEFTAREKGGLFIAAHRS